jgi:hypothetical protein
MGGVEPTSPSDSDLEYLMKGEEGLASTRVGLLDYRKGLSADVQLKEAEGSGIEALYQQPLKGAPHHPTGPFRWILGGLVHPAAFTLHRADVDCSNSGAISKSVASHDRDDQQFT